MSLKWIQEKKIQELQNPNLVKIGPDLHMGGLKCLPGDIIVTDNHGLPHIILAGCCG